LHHSAHPFNLSLYVKMTNLPSKERSKAQLNALKLSCKMARTLKPSKFLYSLLMLSTKNLVMHHILQDLWEVCRKTFWIGLIWPWMTSS
jgi:hypothetical protein